MMTNLNTVPTRYDGYGEMPTCEPRDTKPETAKEILENMDAILKELSNELRRIDDAIYSPTNVENTKELNEPKQECFLGTLNRQRNRAEALLLLAIHIREGLW